MPMRARLLMIPRSFRSNAARAQSAARDCAICPVRLSEKCTPSSAKTAETGIGRRLAKAREEIGEKAQRELHRRVLSLGQQKSRLAAAFGRDRSVIGDWRSGEI